VGPRARLNTAVARRENPIIFPAGNRIMDVQPIAYLFSVLTELPRLLELVFSFENVFNVALFSPYILSKIEYVKRYLFSNDSSSFYIFLRFSI
jgi:hypothetical protein